MKLLRALAPGLTAFAAACAQAYPPPGGAVDRAPPAVISTTPEHLAIVEPNNRAFVFRFDKRISERAVENLVVVSPETGELSVERGRTELRVSIRGGWKPNQVYRIVLAPGLRDLFGNERRHPVEIVFSTGPPIQATALAGVITDRLTGRPYPAGAARIEAVAAEDSTVHIASADVDGLFAMRFLPEGRYTLRAYLDQNRNRRLDPSEPRAEAPVQVSVTDTALAALALLAPDTTPAQLARAESRDSLQIALTFDDHLDPARRPFGVVARLWQLPDSIEIAVDTLLYPHEQVARMLARQQAEAGTAGRGGPAQPGAAALPGGRGGAPTAGRDTLPSQPLPTRELILIPRSPLQAEVHYRVEISGIVNLHGLAGGGGSVTFEAVMPRIAPALPPGRTEPAAANVDDLPATPDPVDSADPDATPSLPDPLAPDGVR